MWFIFVFGYHKYTYSSIFFRGEYMKYSNAQKEATARYNKKAYDRIDVVVKKGQRQIIKDFAASQGKSLNRFILDAIEFQMRKDNKTEWAVS